MRSGSIIRKLRLFFSENKDYHSILGVDRDADQAEIKKAFAKKAHKLHPDCNNTPNAKKEFAETLEAYQVLTSENKENLDDFEEPEERFENRKNYQRQTYQKYQSQNQKKSTSRRSSENFKEFFRKNQGFGQNFSYGEIYEDFDDFEDFFEEKTRSSKKKEPEIVKGDNVTVPLTIDFLNAANGFETTVSYKAFITCETCSGSRCREGMSPSTCSSCYGRGIEKIRQGPLAFEVECEECDGSGSVIKYLCLNCRGIGQVSKYVKETVIVPRGSDSGNSIVIEGKGHSGDPGTQRGDLIVKLTVKKDHYFTRENFDISTKVLISPSQAVLGQWFEIRTIGGYKKFLVPPGTNSGSKVTIKGQGIHKTQLAEGERGNHVVTVSIKIPSSVTPEQKKIFQKLKEIDEKVIRKKDSELDNLDSHGHN